MMDKARLKRIEQAAATFAEKSLKSRRAARKALKAESACVQKNKVLIRKRSDSEILSAA